jgi:archaellum biogenesis ATPase FlaH
MQYIIGKNPCPRCVSKGMDTSGNNYTYYGEDRGGFCFSCGYTEQSEAHKEEKGIGKYVYVEEVVTKELITKEESKQLKGYTSPAGKNQRGISDATYAEYCVRFKYDESTGEVCEVYYPYTEAYVAAGYKVRTTPIKKFYSVGRIGKTSELFGQWKWKETRGKYVVLCAGELDALSVYQMLETYRKGRGSDFDPIPVVSSAIGESGSNKQIQLQYAWLNQFEKVVVCYDNDAAGKAAVKLLVGAIPKGKMFVMSLTMKDANEYLVAGKDKQFLRLFFDAAPYSPDGILGSSSLGAKIRESISIPKIPLPPFMHEVEDAMAGGIPLGVIVNLGSASGTGKSTIADECTYYWIFNSPHRIGILSLESDAGQYGIKVLSRHLGCKIDLLETPEEKLKFISSEGMEDKEAVLWSNPDGTDRWHLIEDRDGGIDSIKEKIMELIVACECKVIIIDPLQDLMDGLSYDEQAVFQRWMKGVLKSHGVTFININHTRKTGQGTKQGSTGADLHEEDLLGSSSIFKSAACNLLFSRNKEAEDELEKNTTYMKMTKCRWTGNTGLCGQYYYDNATHTLWDKKDWMEANGKGF